MRCAEIDEAATNERTIVPALPDEEEQVAVGGLHVQDVHLDLRPGPGGDLEELALMVGLNVQGNGAGHAGQPGRSVSDLQASADAGELVVKQVGIHNHPDTVVKGQVRKEPHKETWGRIAPSPRVVNQRPR
jgi:hypothetical protein